MAYVGTRLLLLTIAVFSGHALGADISVCDSQQIGTGHPSARGYEKRIREAVSENDWTRVQYYFQLGGTFLGNEALEPEAQKKLRKVRLEANLLEAVKRNDTDSIRSLLHSGANPDVRNASDFDFTPLMIAARCGYYEAVGILLNYNANVYLSAVVPESYVSQYTDVTALHLAAATGDEKIVDALLNAGAKATAKACFVADIRNESASPKCDQTPAMWAKTATLASKILSFSSHDPCKQGARD